MAFFEKKNEKKNYFTAATIVTEGTTIIGNFIGNDSIHINGHVFGDVKVNNVVIIGKNGIINGKIKAQQIISSGTCNSNIVCDSLEVMENSTINGQIKSNKILVKGNIKGDINCSGLFVSKEALLESNIQAKNITIAGTIIGLIATKEIKILPSSCIKGKLFSDRIINQGGHIEGYIGKYAELILANPQLSTSKKSVTLLEHSDYYVNIEKEIENKTNNSKKQSADDDFFIDVEIDDIDNSKLFAV